MFTQFRNSTEQLHGGVCDFSEQSVCFANDLLAAFAVVKSFLPEDKVIMFIRRKMDYLFGQLGNWQTAFISVKIDCRIWSSFWERFAWSSLELYLNIFEEWFIENLILRRESWELKLEVSLQRKLLITFKV